ncbi:hypothetical protein AWB78_06198 [Caballeronia calidae]|uniref:DUF2889 domain-containing protein n=2 Tax=Caballeronia calidae TaxID=1777139 RepID=A0A158E706_9BURK|nr:hypothetical protein AWB78_06198 [Caballeronia calidae]
MTVRIVFDQSLTVKSIDTQTAFAPYAACKSGGTNFDSLIGLRMIQGWSREVKSRLKGASSCTHLMELLGPMATTAYQTLADVRINTAPELDKDGRPVKIDSCWAYVAHGDVVQHLWPNFYRPSGNRTP